jgi:hypothetical protein
MLQPFNVQDGSNLKNTYIYNVDEVSWSSSGGNN